MKNPQNISVCVVHNGSFPQLERTLDSLKKQTVPADFHVLEGREFWSASRNRYTFGGDYVLYLYSGSVLAENALDILTQAIKTKASWYYFDEQLFAQPKGSVEKPDFGMLAFAGTVYTGEGVLFSRESLESMTLRYEGNHFTIALMEMTIAAALHSDGVPIPSPLLTRHNRKEITAEEQALLADALTGFLETRNAGLKCVGKGNAPGVYLFPEKTQKRTISLLNLSDTDSFSFRQDWDVIRLSGDGTYLEKCIRGAREATGDLLCVIGADCSPPSRADWEKLVSYASLPYIGLVSPCLYQNASILYAGAFSMAGIPFQMTRADADFSQLWKDVYSVRETGMPAWQFWMADRKLILELADILPDTEALPPEYAVLELAFRATALGRRSLYVGDVLMRCGMEPPKTAPGSFCDMLFRWKERFFLDPFCPSALRSRMRDDKLKNVKALFPAEMPEFKPGSRKILVLTHELSLTGAPVVLSHAIPILKEAGWQIVTVSPCDGVLKDAFLKEQVPVLVLGDMDQNGDWLRFAADFDLILVNTVVPFRQIMQLETVDVPVLWWLHDAKSGYESYLRHVLPDTLGKNIHTFSVSQYADDAVHTYRPQYQTGLLLYGLKEEADRLQPSSPVDTNGRKLFVTVGTVIPRKGQDILAQAIRLLPDSVREQCLFLFVGKNLDSGIFRHIEDVQQAYPDAVRHIPAIPREEIFSLYRQADAVICSSRDDPMPTFMAETMMMSGVCICSENTGMAGVIRHGENGFLYPDDDPEKLARCIQAVFEQQDLTPLRKNARSLFEEVFTMDIFKTNLLRCIAQCLGETEHA